MEGGVRFNTETKFGQQATAKTVFAVSTDDLRPTMMGVYFDIGPEESKFVATDGHRLVRFINKNFTSEKVLSFIVPDKALGLVSKSLNAAECELIVTDDHARFSRDRKSVV